MKFLTISLMFIAGTKLLSIGLFISGQTPGCCFCIAGGCLIGIALHLFLEIIDL